MRGFDKPHPILPGWLNSFPGPQLILGFMALMILFSVAGGITAPRPKAIDQKSWLMFTDIEALGLEQTIINGVWREHDIEARKTGGIRHCGIRRYGVLPKKRGALEADLAGSDWQRAGPASAVNQAPLWHGQDFCNMERFASVALGKTIVAAMANPDNLHLSAFRSLPDGWVLHLYGVTAFDDQSVWTWFHLKRQEPPTDPQPAILAATNR
ncbi:MAG: hypothetical protein AAGG79_03265 [Pseudomonadota bacterium]